MSELRRRLDREAGQVQAEPRALDEVLHRAERRRRTRRIATGVVGLVLAAGTLTLAYAAFNPRREVGPAGPVPGPTASPGALPIEIVTSTANETTSAYVLARLDGQGSAIRNGGYDVTVTVRNNMHQPPHTLINCPVEFDHEAELLRRAMFPTATIGPALPDEDVALRITLGRDFEEQDDGGLAAFELTDSFMNFRALRDGRANELLANEAADQYHRGEGGLELFGYTDRGYRVMSLRPGEGGGFAVVVLAFEDGPGVVRKETLLVGDPDPGDGHDQVQILSARLTEAPSSAESPTTDEVEAFVEAFLEARHDRSGAGTYLGEDARAAYAAHEGGLDLLGYAAGPGPLEARVVVYDELSPERHRVAVRFDGAGVDPPVVWETLLIERLGADEFEVLDAERGFSRESDPPPPEDPEQAVAAFVLEELDSPYVGTCPEGLGPQGSVPEGVCSVRFETGENRVVYRVGPPFSEWLGELELERDETGLWSVTRYEAFPPPGG
ncbi:MAG: hypothetical protein ACRDHB_08045 [Actinomycetota bacterium]